MERAGPDFGPEKCLKEFTCWIYVADIILAQSFTLNLDRNGTFQQFENGPKLQFDT